MKFMHTKLPEFIKKIKTAGNDILGDKRVRLEGIENLQFAKMQSLRTGRIENAIRELANDENSEFIEVQVIPRVPETMHTVIIKSMNEDGETEKVILEILNIIHPTEDFYVDGCKNVEDRRPPLGKH